MSRKARRRKAQAAEAAQAAAESYRINGQEFVERRMFLPVGWGWDSPGWLPGIGEPGAYAASPDERRHGRDEFFQSDTDIANARTLARYVTTVNCPAIGIGENLKNYVIGKGFTFSVATKKKESCPKGMVDAVQDVLDQFLDMNDFVGDLDRELFWRSRRDGEFFLALYPTKSGLSVCRVIEPEQVTDPGGAPWEDDLLNQLYRVNIDVATNWEFGVHKAEHDVQQVFGYHVEWSIGDNTYMPARAVEHHKANVDRNIARGITDFFPAWKWLQQQARLLENTGEGAAELAAISYIIQHVEGVTKEQTETMRRARADRSFTVNGKTYHKEYRPAGSKLDVPHGQEYLPGPMGAERGQAFLQVVQGILRQVATRWAMTEGMISGDDSNNTMACHDDITECLTQDGWVTYDRLRPDLPVATVNPQTGEVEFQRPRAIHVHNYAGPLVHFHGSHQLDVMVTPNHRMWVSKVQHARVGGRAGKMQLTGNLHPFQFREAGDLVGKASRYYMQFSGDPARGELPEVLVLPCEQRPRKLTEDDAAEIRRRRGVESQSKLAKRFGICRQLVQQIQQGRAWRELRIGRRGDMTVNSRDWLEFLGYWLAEGWTCEYTTKSGGRSYVIGVCQNEGVEADRIASVLSRLGFHPHRRDISPEQDASRYDATRVHYKWQWSDKGICRWLRSECGTDSHTKRIPAAIKRLDASLLMILLDALIAGDGRDLEFGTRKYFTSSRQLADDVQEIGVRCGFVATIEKPDAAGKYTVTLKQADARRRGFNPRQNVSLHEYVGIVWCCTVDNGLMITRRNGKPAVTGNSSIVAGSRFHRYAIAAQHNFVMRCQRIIWKVLRHAFDSGIFLPFGFGPRAESWNKFMRLIEVDIEPPDVDEKRTLEQTQERAIKNQAGILSLKTWSLQESLDYEQEQENRKLEQTQVVPPGPPGQPPGQPPGMPGQRPNMPGLPGAGGQQMPGLPQPTAPKATSKSPFDQMADDADESASSAIKLIESVRDAIRQTVQEEIAKLPQVVPVTLESNSIAEMATAVTPLVFPGGNFAQGVGQVASPLRKSVLLAPVPEPMAGRIKELALFLPAQDVVEPELQPHITVKYGILTDDPKWVVELLRDEGPFLVTIGELSVFPADENRDADVLKLEVRSEVLHKLHQRLKAAIQNIDTYPTYNPHITVAYMRPGSASRHAGKCPLTGSRFYVSDLVFSDAEKQRTIIPLTGMIAAEAQAAHQRLCTLLAQASSVTDALECYP